MKNYALITEGIDKLLVEAYEKKDKATTKAVLNEIKSNKKLQTLYTLVDNLKNGEVDVENIDFFIKENIEFAQKTDFSTFDKLLESELAESNLLIESIGVILFEKRTPKNLIKYSKAFNNVRNHLKEKNTWKQELSKKLEEQSVLYKDLSNEDKTLFENFIKSSKEGKKEIHESIKKECVELLNTHIKESSDLSMKVKLYETRDMILSLNESDENYINNIVKMHDLKKGLLK